MEEILKKIEKEISENNGAAGCEYRAGLYKAIEIIQSEQNKNSFSWECPICHTIIGLDLASKEDASIED